MWRWLWFAIIWLALATWALAAGHGPLTLAWDAVTVDTQGGAVTIAYYNVQWGISAGQQNSGTGAAASVCSGNNCQFTVRGLNPQLMYWFVVTAVDTLGRESAVSNEVPGRPTIVIHR